MISIDELDAETQAALKVFDTLSPQQQDQMRAYIDSRANNLRTPNMT